VAWKSGSDSGAWRENVEGAERGWGRARGPPPKEEERSIEDKKREARAATTADAAGGVRAPPLAGFFSKRGAKARKHSRIGVTLRRAGPGRQ